MEFGERLAKLRAEQGMKQSDVAAFACVDQSMISKYEKGIHYPDFPTLIKLADCFGVSVDYLIGRTAIRTDMCTFENGLHARGGTIPLDVLFRLDEDDRELVRLLITSFQKRPEYQKRSKNSTK